MLPTERPLRAAAAACAALLLASIPAAAQTQEELEYGFHSDRALSAANTLVLNPAVEARLAALGNRVAAGSARPELKYTFRIANDATINAWATAGGFVYVTSGLLDVIESEDELAAVLGHEIAHSANGHQIRVLYDTHKKLQRNQWTGRILGTVLAAAAGAAMPEEATKEQVRDIMDLGFDAGQSISDRLTVSMILGFGRELELEADSVGLALSSQAGFDPYGMVRLFRRLASIRDDLGITPERYASGLINAEPGLEERIRIADEQRRRLRAEERVGAERGRGQ